MINLSKVISKFINGSIFTDGQERVPLDDDPVRPKKQLVVGAKELLKHILKMTKNRKRILA